MSDRYGVQYYTQCEDFKDKSLGTLHRKYGNDINNVMMIQEFVDKIAKTKEHKYGNPYYSNIKKQIETVNNFSEDRKNEIKTKRIKFNRDHYGVDYSFQRYDTKEKIKGTNRLRYGFDYPMQNPDFRRKTMKKYTYDGITFSSKPEIAYYIWLTDNNIRFEYEPNVRFEYTFDNKTRYYHPDFYLIDDNVFVEIKGDQFFNKDGVMKNPFDNDQSGIYRAKQQCMVKNHIKIIRSDEYSIYLQYVSKKIW